MLPVVCFLAIFLFQAAVAQNVVLGRYSYTGVVHRGNDILVFNSSAGVELRVSYPAQTNVQYCESERNETSDNATLTFYAQQFGVKLYETSLAGGTQKQTGNVSLSETYFPYLVSCDAGKINFLGTEPALGLPIYPSMFLKPVIFDCVNRTAFVRQTVVTELNCSYPTPQPTTGFTSGPTVAYRPTFSSANSNSVSLLVVVAAACVLFFMQ
jgi:hypothetical protein